MTQMRDVNTYMKIRWYANAIENLAISAYAGYPERIASIVECLDKAFECLQTQSQESPEEKAARLAKSSSSGTSTATESSNAESAEIVIAPRTDCPWTTCPDGSCRPRCDKK